MQLSNRLTFSLASLILMFGFVVMPVMADDGGTAIPAGGDTANHGTDGHADQAEANTAENNVPGHKHPQIMISAKDSDPTKTGIQVIPTAAAGTAAAEQLAVAFPVEITIPKNAYSGTSGSAAPSDSTLSSTNTTGMSFIGNGSGGVVALDSFVLKANTTYVITAVATVTLVDPAASPTDATAKARRESVLAADTPLEVKVMVTHSVISSSDTRGDYSGQANLPAEMTFTLIPAEVSEKVAWKVTGTPSVTDDFTVTLTADEEDAMLIQTDVKVDGGTVIRFGEDPFPPAGKTVYNAEIRPALHARMISVTIDDAAAAAKPAAGDMGKVEASIGEASITDISPNPATANDQADFEVVFTFNRALPNPLMLEDLSIGTMAGASGDMMDGDKANDAVTGAKDPMFLGTPNRVPGESMKWRVTVSPKAGMNTIVGLSTAGMTKFTYGSGVTALTVKESTLVETGGTIGAKLSADEMTVTLDGSIAANGFAVIDHTNFRDLEEFFDIGGTIGLHDTDSADDDDDNSREVIISEILWGLDFGATVIANQNQWQFIELYNTTNTTIDLTGWTLKFTEGRPVPKSDVDQVSNRSGVGWEVDIGQSGRVTGTTAADAKNLITPINVVSMYRNINYVKVEKVKADGTADPSREEQLKGIPGGNAKGSWKASTRRDSATPAGVGITGAQAARWIYSTRGREHYTTTAILTASAVARTPFIVNEVGNGSDDTNDWVEIRNVTSSEASLKNYHLSAVTGFDTDTSLVNFKDKDIKVPGNSVILLVNTDPKTTGIAAGRNAAVAEADQERTGVTSRYYIDANLKLPDDGKFNLILRNAHDKLKASSDNFIDVIGGLIVEDDTKGTSQWPLVATGAPHGDVVEANGRELKEGYVYIRKNVDGGTGEHHLGRAGYTGIGYDRTASKSDANGGTPGYANDALKEKEADLLSAEITISEVMVDTGDLRTGLPQWIELYNSSMTQAVNLNGWKLMIENAADADVSTFSATLTLDAMTISPNQTVLIVSTSGRPSHPDQFPSTRVVNLWVTKKHREELEMARRTDQVLSPKGFHLKLVDKDNKTLDEAGNIDGDRRTRDEATWVIPMSEEEGRRSSLIRRYDDDTAIDGEIEDGWVLASDTNLAHAISHTFYGNADDYGTPGYRGGGPLPVSLSKFRPERLDDGTIVVRWMTESELNNAGFNILRSEKRDGEFTQINTKMIAGKGTTSERTTYSFPDTSAKPNVVYYYQIQDVSLDGKVTTLRQSRLKGHVSAAGKLTTTWGELKSLQ